MTPTQRVLMIHIKTCLSIFLLSFLYYILLSEVVVVVVVVVLWPVNRPKDTWTETTCSEFPTVYDSFWWARFNGNFFVKNKARSVSPFRNEVSLCPKLTSFLSKSIAFLNYIVSVLIDVTIVWPFTAFIIWISPPALTSAHWWAKHIDFLFLFMALWSGILAQIRDWLSSLLCYKTHWYGIASRIIKQMFEHPTSIR